MPEKIDPIETNDDSITLTKDELKKLIQEEGNKQAAATRRKYEMKDNPALLELQEKVEALQDELDRNKRAYDSLSGKNKTLLASIKEKEETITLAQKERLLDKARYELDSKLQKIQFVDPAIGELLRENLERKLSPEMGEDGKLNVKVGDITLDESIEAYLKEKPQFVKSNVIPGPKANTRPITAPFAKGETVTREQVQAAQANGTLSSLINGNPEIAKQVSSLLVE